MHVSGIWRQCVVESEEAVALDQAGQTNVIVLCCDCCNLVTHFVMSADNKQDTVLPKSEVMRLLKDPSSLVQLRDSTAMLRSKRQVRSSFHVVSSLALLVAPAYTSLSHASNAA